ncbi:allophanate hydrolase [Paenibacillus sp. XY044]|uniref:allophanate hydrolase n=1 Tax=Paenibacillus sp. XY044 TaxID=2026089 RepID=UPI000B98EF2D|nr:allophanate hydrolase [Paenibacillus sp. XY044]OZB91272.1 allophanate hydrolase [Paenibacillus sp. XY044]
MNTIRTIARKTSLPESLTITRLMDLYQERRITPRQVIEEIIERAEADREMNIWIEAPTMERIAPYLEQLEALDPANCPLWGIPFAVKDNVDVAGYPTTAACPDFQYEPGEHAFVVQKLIDAGAIPVGKTNLDQFATGLVGTRSPYGETHNALKPELISGGSSSGSSVAVARGQAAFSLGTDTAGSGRVPAALNRLVGWKPSLGAWSVGGVVPASASLDCVTVFTNQLQDALTVDRIVRSVDDGDCWSKALPMNPAQAPLKLLIPEQTDLFFGPFAAEYEQAWGRALRRIESLGIPIERIDISLFREAAKLLYDGAWVAERWASLGDFVQNRPGSVLPVTEQILRSGADKDYDASSVFQAIHLLQQYKRKTAAMLACAVLVLPTCGGTWRREDVARDPLNTNRELGRYTNHCNLLDLCAAAMPGGDAAEDLPFGVTFFALSGNEHLIEYTAGKFEDRNRPALEPEVSVKSDTTQVAVCGLHMRGFPLEKQMCASGARFVRETLTAPKYRMVKLDTVPAKPGLIKVPAGGAKLRLEVWEMPLSAFGEFTASIPAPLGIGKVELEDGREIPGFLCEAYAAEGLCDITASGGWKNAVSVTGQ